MNSTTTAAAAAALSSLSRRFTHLSLQSSKVSKRAVGEGLASSTLPLPLPFTSSPPTRSIQSLVVVGKCHSRSTGSYSYNLGGSFVNNKQKSSNNNNILLSSSSLTQRPFSSSKDDKGSSSNDRDLEWNKFQETLIFDETKLSGSMTKKTKRRGGKTLRKKKAKELELMEKHERISDAGGGKFPSMRYSDEETERLLKEAYDNLPKKGISKKTRQLKRMRNRFKLIRRARYVKKQEKIAHHFARMEKRSLVVKEVRKVKEDANEIREKDLMYQKKVLMKWAEIQGLTAVKNDNEVAVAIDSQDGIEKKEEKM